MRRTAGLLVQRVGASPVAWGGATTVLRGLGFLVVMAYALRKIPTEEIGLWYVMLTIAGLGRIVEFGFAATIGRFTSYYYGGAVEVPALGISRSGSGTANLGAVASLVRMARGLYLVFGVLIGALMLVVWLGWQFVDPEMGTFAGSREAAAFFVLLTGTAFNMTGMYWPAILYGTNRVRLYNQLMVTGLLANYALAVSGLVAGWGILALASGHVVGTLVTRFAARLAVRRRLAGAEPAAEATTTWRALWPTTWRAGVLTLSTYLTIGLTTVFCYTFADILTAASYGLTMQVALMLHTTATQWVWVKIPVISAMRVQGNWRGILGLLRWRMPAAVVSYGLGATVVVLAAPVVLSALGSQTQVLPRPTLVALLVLIGLDLVLGLHSSLLQTGNEVPHVRSFALSACLTLLLMWPLGSRFHVWGVIGAPFLAQLAVNYWWVPSQFWTRFRDGLRAQQDAPVSSAPAEARP